MKSNALYRSSFVVLLALGVLSTSVGVCSAAAEDQNFKYETFSMEGQRLRFNKETGEVEKLVMTATGMAWVKQDVVQGGAQPTDPKDQKVAAAQKPTTDIKSSTKQSSGTTATIVQTPTGYPPRQVVQQDPLDPAIHILDDTNQDITDILTDEHRKGSAPTITNYENKLAIAQTFNIGEHITGTIMVRNAGDKRLRAMELTMVIPVKGKAKPEERRFLFVDKTGQTPPPQPTANGKEGMPLLQKVDIPAPAGEVISSPELRITYLQFAE